jgi:hypothetical protein
MVARRRESDRDGENGEKGEKSTTIEISGEFRNPRFHVASASPTLESRTVFSFAIFTKEIMRLG